MLTSTNSKLQIKRLCQVFQFFVQYYNIIKNIQKPKNHQARKLHGPVDGWKLESKTHWSYSIIEIYNWTQSSKASIPPLTTFLMQKLLCSTTNILFTIISSTSLNFSSKMNKLQIYLVYSNNWKLLNILLFPKMNQHWHRQKILYLMCKRNQQEQDSCYLGDRKIKT